MYKEKTFKPTGAMNIKAKVKLLASNSSWELNATRWDTYKVYETESKSILFIQKFQTMWAGEKDTTKVEIFETLEDLKKDKVDHLGIINDRVKEVLIDAGCDMSITVE